MQEIWSMLPDLKGDGDPFDAAKIELFNNGDKSWWYICQAWDLILREFDGGHLMIVNTIIGEAQEEILGVFCNKVLDMTNDPVDPEYSAMEKYDLHMMVPLVLTIYGEDRFARIIQLGQDEEQKDLLRKWASTANLIDWDKVDKYYDELDKSRNLFDAIADKSSE